MRMRITTQGELTSNRTNSSCIPILPRRIALIDTGDGDRSATSLILDDFEEAFRAYAHHDSGPGCRIPKIARVSSDRLSALDELSDTVVLGYAVGDGTLPVEALELISTLAEGTRLYAIAADGRYGRDGADNPFGALEHLCARSGVSWRGGLVANASEMIPACAGMPRMGMARRRLSEATDKLILAVRCGIDAGLIEARAPIPRFVYSLIHNRGKRQCHNAA